MPPRAEILPWAEVVEVTPEQVLLEHNQLRNAFDDPYPGGGASWKYKGQCVRWRLSLHRMAHGGGGDEIMTFAADQPNAIIGAQVLATDYPKLRLGPYEARRAFDVLARVEDVHECRMFLRDVVLSEVLK